MFAQPTGCESTSAVRLSSTWAVPGVTIAASQAGMTSAGSVGPNRENVTGRSRRPNSLAIAALPNRTPDPSVIAPPERDAHRQAAPARCERTDESPRGAEAAEQARAGEGEQPRVGGLPRGQDRLRAGRGQLEDDAADRRDEDEGGQQPEPHGRREDAVVAGGRWPGEPDGRDGDRDEGREADQQVDRTARPVAE